MRGDPVGFGWPGGESSGAPAANLGAGPRAVQHRAGRRVARYRSSLNPGSTAGRRAAFATIHPVAYIHRVTRVSFA